MNKAIAIALMISLCVVIGALSRDAAPVNAKTPTNYQDRFTTYGPNNRSYPTHAYVIVDNETGVEYMMIETPGGNFGGENVAICPLYEANGKIKVSK